MQQKYIEDKYYIAVFESRNHAVALYQYLNIKNYKQYDLISTPCKIKSGCSYSIKFIKYDDLEYLQKLSEKNGHKILDIYVVKRRNGKKVINKLSEELK